MGKEYEGGGIWSLRTKIHTFKQRLREVTSSDIKSHEGKIVYPYLPAIYYPCKNMLKGQLNIIQHYYIEKKDMNFLL